MCVHGIIDKRPMLVPICAGPATNNPARNKEQQHPARREAVAGGHEMVPSTSAANASATKKAGTPQQLL